MSIFCAVLCACGVSGSGSILGGSCKSTMEFQQAVLVRNGVCQEVQGGGCGGPTEHRRDLESKIAALETQGWQEVDGFSCSDWLGD